MLTSCVCVVVVCACVGFWGAAHLLGLVRPTSVCATRCPVWRTGAGFDSAAATTAAAGPRAGPGPGSGEGEPEEPDDEEPEEDEDEED